jgi:serine phosphatase RsbU (regulator of sigma subunit)
MMPGTCYEEHEATLAPGEGHNTQQDMFGFPRLKALIGEHSNAPDLIDFLLNELANFTGEDWEQEDDVTMVAIRRDRVHSS